MDRDVKNGCCSCAYYKLPLANQPCKSCVKWSNWVDAKEEPDNKPKD